MAQPPNARVKCTMCKRSVLKSSVADNECEICQSISVFRGNPSYAGIPTDVWTIFDFVSSHQTTEFQCFYWESFLKNDPKKTLFQAVTFFKKNFRVREWYIMKRLGRIYVCRDIEDSFQKGVDPVFNSFEKAMQFIQTEHQEEQHEGAQCDCEMLTEKKFTNAQSSICNEH